MAVTVSVLVSGLASLMILALHLGTSVIVSPLRPAARPARGEPAGARVLES